MSNFGVYPPSSGREVRAQLKVLIADITLTNIGSFEAIPIPAGFDHIILEGYLRSTKANVVDVASVFINRDFTTTNYRTQILEAASSVTTSANTNDTRFMAVPAANSPANEYGYGYQQWSFINSSAVKSAYALGYQRRSTGTSVALIGLGTNSTITEPITAITVRTPNHPTDLFVTGSRLQIFGLGTFAVALAR